MKKLFTLAALAACGLSAKAQIGSVGIGTTSPNSAAALDINSATKGLLIPRVSLTGTANAAPLSAHVAGMVVYNTASAGDVTPGTYFNNGTKWVKITNSSNDIWRKIGSRDTTITIADLNGNNNYTVHVDSFGLNEANLGNANLYSKNIQVKVVSDSVYGSSGLMGVYTVRNNTPISSYEVTSDGIEMSRTPASLVPDVMGYIDFKDSMNKDYAARLMATNNYVSSFNGVAHPERGYGMAMIAKNFMFEVNKAYLSWQSAHSTMRLDSINGFQTLTLQPIKSAVGLYDFAKFRVVSSDSTGQINLSALNFTINRDTVGNDWKSTTTRIQRVIDTTRMGFIDFGIADGRKDEVGIDTSRNNGLGFGYQNKVGMVLANTGNIGIGVTKPIGKLHIRYEQPVSDTLNHGFANDIVFDNYEPSSNDGLSLAFRRFRGTPVSPSNVKSGDRLGGFNFMGQLNGLMRNIGTIGVIYKGNGTNQKSSMYFAVNSGEADSSYNTVALYIDTTTNVGMGTQAPQAKLDVKGYIKVGSVDASIDALAPTAIPFGTIRYNATLGRGEMYVADQNGDGTKNDSGWRPM